MGRLSKTKWLLLGCLIVVLGFVAGSIFVPNGVSDVIKWVANNDLTVKLRAPVEQEKIQDDSLIEMVVDSIGVSQISYQPVVILKEKGGELYLPIWIGPAEANAISIVMEGVDMPRPLTSDLLCSIIDRLGANVDYIVVNDIQDNTFYANIALYADWTQMEIDARPSDAIAIALRNEAAIYVAREVLEKAGVTPEYKADEYTPIL